MTKAELVAKVAKSANASQAMTANIIDSTLVEIKTLLSKGGNISFTGFGSFSVSKRAKRKGRNPQTGKEMIIAATKVARFRPGKGLKDSVAGRR